MAEGARITIDAQLQFRHDVEANWLAADPILKVGEPAYTIGYSDRFKLGDGQSKWSELPYLQLGEGGGSQAYESLAWSAIKTLTSGSASVLAQAYAVKQAYTELKSLIPNLADYYTKEQINALIPSLEGYAKESWVLGKGYATENFVNTKIADLINGAPTTLDTLKEIADAFAQSQDVIEALDEAIGKKANQSDLTALAARVATNEGNITGLSNNKLDKSIWDSVFEIDAKGNLRAKVGIYSTSFISARTSDPSAGGGSGGAFSLYTWDQVKAMTAEVGGVAPTAYALKQAYNELINATPTLSWNNIQDKPIFANVATSGSYSDLIGRPTALSDLANDVGYITSAALGGFASESWVSNNFLGLSGGTIKGTFTIRRSPSVIVFETTDGSPRGSLGVVAAGPVYYDTASVGYDLIHSGNIGSYNAGSATKFATARTIWGQSFDGTGNVSSTLYLPNNIAIASANASGTNKPILRFNSSNVLVLGEGTSTSGYNTVIQGNNVYLQYGASNTNGLILNSAGNVLIGTTTDNDAKLYVKDTRTDRLGGNLIVDGSGTAYGFGYMGIGLRHNGEGKGGFGWNSVPLSAGANNTAGIYIANDISGDHINLYNEGGIYAYTSLFQTNGTIYSAVGLYTPGYLSARSTAGSSDRNLKTNIAPIRNALAYILGTNYVSFDWKDTGEHSVGIIAQEELNREWSCLVQKYNEHYSYQYTQHTALLGSALQEEDKKVEALRTEMATLKNRVQKLERQLWQQ